MTAATLLVTGATGAAGSFIVPALLKAGFKVRGQFRRRPGERRDVEWRPFDFSREGDIAPLVAGCDGVIHLSAELRRVEAMDQVNVTATQALARAADAAGARYFGHASSIVVYGSPRTRRVTEATPLIDLTRPMAEQYHAEPYMLEYARTKTLGEIAVTRNAGRMNVDILRPAVVADLDRLLESANWSKPRRIFALYRRTQYIYAEDAAAAVVHLVRRGLAAQSGAIESYNICDEDCGTFRHLHERALAATGETCFRSPIDVPVVADVAKDLLRHRTLALRYPLGMMEISNRKLLATGFCLPCGFEAALDLALERRSGGRDAASSSATKQSAGAM